MGGALRRPLRIDVMLEQAVGTMGNRHRRFWKTVQAAPRVNDKLRVVNVAAQGQQTCKTDLAYAWPWRGSLSTRAQSGGQPYMFSYELYTDDEQEMYTAFVYANGQCNHAEHEYFW